MSKEDFCRAWSAASNVGEVCEILGIKPANAMAKASYYRSQGIELKKFKQGRPASPISTEEMNATLAKDRERMTRQEIIREVIKHLYELATD